MKKEIAKNLLSIGAVFLRPEDPFTWASGIKSPVYCDNRLTLTAPAARTVVETAIAETNPGFKEIIHYLKHNKYLFVVLIAMLILGISILGILIFGISILEYSSSDSSLETEPRSLIN